MLKYRECSLILTDLCNIRCSHCCLSTNNKKNAKIMPRGRLEKYVKLLREAGVEKINITGGEPFTFFDALVSAIALISDWGISATVVTNAFWALNKATTQSILSKLAEAGLSEIHFSTDRFHLEHISLDHVMRACQASSKLGMPTYVFTTSLDDNIHERLLKSKLRKMRVRQVEQPLMVKDKAAQNRIEEKYKVRIGHPQLHDGPCLSVINPLIDPSGLMFICCSPIADYKKNSLFFLYDLNKTNSSNRLLQDEHTLSQYLLEHGPLSLYKQICSRTGNPYIERMLIDSCSNNCTLCNRIMVDKKNKGVVKEVLIDFSPKDELIYEFQSYP